MKQRLMRLLRRHWGLLLMLVVVTALLPTVGAPLLVNSENRRLIEEARTGDSLYQKIQVGDLYREGSYAIDVDLDEAARWYLLAAEGGHPLGKTRLAEAYTYGAGVPQDTRIAFRLYLEAANQGWLEAMLKLSVLYEHGLGVEADLVEAYRWAWLAHAAGQMELREQVQYQAIVSSDPKSLEPVWRITDPAFESLSETQKEDAMRRAREWRPTTAEQ